MARALHYPSIEFQDIDALKRSLLIWDGIHRIVPAGYAPQDDAEVRVAVQAGAIDNLTLEAIEKHNAAHRFLDYYKLRNRPDYPLVWPAGCSSESFTLINPDKIEAKLLPLFESLSQRLTSEGFMEVPDDLAGGYMFYLATSVAERRSLQLTTDSSDCWAVGTYFANEGCFTEAVYDNDADAYLANMAIDDLLPRDLTHVSIDALLRFREDHAEVRSNFHNELNQLKAQISACNNKGHAEYIVNDFVKRFEQAKADYRKTLGFFRREDVCSLLSVGLPTSATMIALPGLGSGDPYEPWRVGVGILLGAVSALASRELGRKPKSIASYLVGSERLSRYPGRTLHRKFEEFIND
ncbi:hypothetical protein G7W60_10315 [Pseudomonas fluorescens]|uniref:hypothetical protein n=1 Tax=Pseudomonas fluorescens TaxID=294 RepID=UPI0014049042|nr:hypothetical protein [Pseudomonas fluorescens]NHN68229.1 hypothetical protein [Pseudomonas fluorescens]